MKTHLKYLLPLTLSVRLFEDGHLILIHGRQEKIFIHLLKIVARDGILVQNALYKDMFLMN